MNILDGLPEIDSLTAEQERALSKRRGASAKNSLVLANMREAFLYAKRCSRGKLADDEVLSVCYAALRAAADNFKPNRGPFFSYCKVYLRGFISREWSAKDVVKSSSRHEGPEATKPDSRHGPDVFERGEVVESDANDDPLWQDGAVEPDFESIHLRERWKLIQPEIRSLPERERMILELTYQSGFSFQKTGEMLSISRQAVQIAIKRAIRRIQRKLESRKLANL